MTHNSGTNWPRFAVGVFLLLVAVGFAVWGFSKTTLSPDQRQILLWILPLASGFSATAFAGSLSVKAKGFWPGLVITATGGFGVWVLTFFLLFPKSRQAEEGKNVLLQSISGNSNTQILTLNIYNYPQVLQKVIEDRGPDFAREFQLGYKLFGIANNEFLPFQGPSDRGILVHWERNQHRYESDGTTITLRLPDIDIQPNMMLHGATVQLPNVVGSRLAFHLDPVFYNHGTAIVGNTWVKSGIKTNTSGGGSPFPHETKITDLTHATVNWGAASTYTFGELKMRGNELWIDGGTLTIGQADAFDHVGLVRDNIFNGSPRGGYRFPRAGVIMGNEFRDGLIDARSLRDGMIVTGNRFVSSAGGFTIGPQPEVSFVIEIVQTQTNGAVLLFGLKSYVE